MTIHNRVVPGQDVTETVYYTPNETQNTAVIDTLEHTYGFVWVCRE